MKKSFFLQHKLLNKLKMFRLILSQTRRPIDLSVFTSAFYTKVSVHLTLRERNNIIGDSYLLQREFKQFLAKTNAVSSFGHNYATNAKVGKSKDLDDFIEELNDRVANKNRISQYELKTLINWIKTQKITDKQTLDILRFCSFGRIDQNLSDTITTIWHELEKHGHEFHTEHYNYLLQFASERQDVTRTQTIFDEMTANGIEPDAISYQCLLSVYCKCGNMHKVVEILGMMEEDELPIDEYSYNNVIQCQIICGNIDAAIETIASMRENGFNVNQDILATLLSHYAKVGDLENIRKTIVAFETENIKLSNGIILNVICELAVNQHVDKVDSLFEYLKPNAELQKSFTNAMKVFVAKQQSAILPKLLQFSFKTGDIKTMYKYLINEMVRQDTSDEEFTETIKSIEANGFTVENNFEIFQPALKGASEEIIHRLLMHMKKNRMDVTDVAFEKLFQLSAKKGIDEVINVVNLMTVDFKIRSHIAYIRDVILPALNVTQDMTLALKKLQETKIPLHRIIKALVNSCLNTCDFKTAIDVLSSHQCFYANKFITETLLNAYEKTGDVQSFVQIVKIIYDNYSNINEYYRDAVLSDAEVRKRQLAFVGEMLYSSIAHTLTDTKSLSQLLEAFITEGLVTTSNQIQKIQQELLKVNDQVEIGRLLVRLSADKLQLKPINMKQWKDKYKQSAAELQSILDGQRTLGRDVVGTEKLLFLAHIRERNVAEVELLMNNSELNITNANYGMLVEMYARIGNMEKALLMLKEARTKDSSFKLYPMTTAELVTLMYENKIEFDEIESFLYTERQDKVILNKNIPFEQLMQRLASEGHTELVERLFNTLVKFNYIEPTLESTGSLITVHLNNKRYDKAVEKYEYLVKAYKISPMSVVLFRELIRENQTDLLQRAVDTHKKIIGESDALSRLAIAYNDCGDDQQARKIFQSNRINDITEVVGKKCRVYAKFDNIESAKILLKSTEGVTCDRRVIYQTILDIYYKQGMAEKALELWTDICNDKVLPTPQFIEKLAELLKANNIELPSDLEKKLTANLKDKSKNRISNN